MKIGKIPPNILNNIIIDPINNNKCQRKEIILRPKTGEDCAAADLGGELLVISTDPITGADNNSGYLAVHVNCNDAASAGAEPIGIMITILLPPKSDEELLKTIMEGAYRAASEVGVEIMGGHTEITDAVTRTVISATVVAKTINRKLIATGGAKVGQDVIMTKYAGLEGTSIIAADYEGLLSKYLKKDIIEKSKSLNSMLSVIKEGRISAEYGATAMHDVTEGGILGAAWEIADCSNAGIEIYADNIPMLPETEAICNIANIDCLKLISSGSMIISAFDGQKLVDKLKEEGINAAIIGRIIDNGKYIIKNGIKSIIEEPETDELYKVNIL